MLLLFGLAGAALRVSSSSFLGLALALLPIGQEHLHRLLERFIGERVARVLLLRLRGEAQQRDAVCLFVRDGDLEWRL